MYGAGVYHYRQPIRSLPQLPTANYRLKPPGLSGCAACGGLGAAETSGNIIPFALLGVGVAVAAVWLLASGSKKKTWFPLFHNVKSRTEAVRLSKLNRYDWPKQKAQQEADGTWSVLAWDLPSEAVRSTNWNR